jgi:hypothetical protein
MMLFHCKVRVRKKILNAFLFVLQLIVPVSTLIILILVPACGPFPYVREVPDVDICPPVFKRLMMSEPDIVQLIFDEPVQVNMESICIDSELTIREVMAVDTSLIFRIENQIVGKEYSLEAYFEDTNGNSVNLIIRFYGFNPSIPGIIINEFITEGSKTHPDLVELKVLKTGNMGGLVFYEGTPSHWEHRFVFPGFSVDEGDFILLHVKPENIPVELDEPGNKDTSGGLDASDTAFDFWIKDGNGLANSNGVITLYTGTGGTILDGVLYSERVSSSDERYLGFGTRKVMEWAQELYRDGGWQSSGEMIRPEDGVNPQASTSTRSICRNRDFKDTDTRHDWHIVPTRMATFGQENCEEKYKE